MSVVWGKLLVNDLFNIYKYKYILNAYAVQ